MDEKKIILLVEDEPPIAMAQKKILERYGYAVITAHSGENAIETVRTAAGIDLILMDVNLGTGKMDGIECAEIILRDKDIPVLFLSCYDQPEIIEKAERVTSYGYIVKESGETALNASIKMAFKLHEAHSGLVEAKETAEKYLKVAAELIISINTRGNITLLNDSGHRLLGYDTGELIGKNWFDACLPEKARKEAKEAFKKLMNGKAENILTYENQVITKNGNERTILWHNTMLEDMTGKVIGLLSSGEDITDRKRMEETLAQKTMLLEAQSETSLDGILAVDSEGRSIMFNERFGELWGIPRHILGTRDDATMLKYVLKQLKDPEEFTRKIEYLYVHQSEESMDEIVFSDGRCFDRYSSPLVAADGTYRGRVWYFRDITDRKRAEQTLKESELRYRGLFESSPDAIILHDGERVLYLNDAAEKLIGSHKKDRIVGRKILDLIHPEDRERMARDIDSIRQTGDTTSIKRMKLVRDDEKIVHVEYTGSSVDYGGPVLLRMFMRDVTDRVRVEKALAKTRQQQQAILDNIPDMAWLKDRDGRYIRANKPFGEACGVEPEHMPGKTDFDIWPKDLAKKYRADDRAVLESGERRQFEELLTDKDGNTRWIETIKTPVFNDGGETIGTAGIARNITQRKEQEEQLRQYREMLEQLVEKRTTELLKVNALLEQELSEHKRTEEKVQGLNAELEQRIIELDAANKELEILNYSVSHGLKTPLVAIEGFSRNLMEKQSHNLDEKGRHFLDIINKSTKKMNELIEDLHAFFSVGLKSIKSSTINMEKMTGDIASDLRSILPDDTFTIGFGTLPAAYGDRKMIRQVLVNLFGNAIKYSRPKGAAVITVEGRTEEGKSIYSVKDKGIGFPMEHADRIFEVFERLHSSDEFEGTGIGLAIVKRIVHKHGGDVWAEGAVNEGATFYFTLPGKDSPK